ncbi:prefoldin domain-containing protein [Salinibacillus xinjiangensis]|uniref:Uncharacterized protein n=1 Tax=Salinibacillus xinjiangensis TaxID=1229268 RepID=A0A6G1X197_9BACI|nr:hypothetical protein [Salinibacillus xinjiangensis]MRG84767.1 hypothetical protein [Salinibacillus xinjiangensis]
MIHHSCPHCRSIEDRIKQHEKYIAQLVDILAKMNQRLIDLEDRHIVKFDSPMSKRF